jgi:glycosyltransferase involved in cell wall biosynthesis
MLANQTLISVVITTKNRINLLPRAIQSILDQSWPTVEIIVVDDGSDAPVELPIADPRLRLIRNEQSKGVSEARNIGFRAAQGQYFCMLDDDDWYLPGKLQLQADYLQQHPDIDLVFSRVITRNAVGEEGYYLPLDHVHTPEINLYAFNLIHPSSALFRREVFDKVQFDAQVKKYEDTLFFNRVCFTFRTAFLPIDVSVWLRDDRPDQLSRRISNANYQSFHLVCESLEDILQRYPAIRRLYYKRLAWQALRSGHIGGLFRAATHAYLLTACKSRLTGS